MRQTFEQAVMALLARPTQPVVHQTTIPCKEIVVSVPDFAKANVEIAYGTAPTFDPKGGKPQAEMHERHVSLPSLKPQVVEAPAIKCPIPTANQPVLRPWFKIPVNTRTFGTWVNNGIQVTQEFDEPLLSDREADQAELGHNFDLPDNESFMVMGLNDPDNTHLNHQAMNDRHFREHCYQRNGKNYVLYLKNTHDLRKQAAGPNYLRPEWVAEQLDCALNFAYQIVDCFKKMSFDEKTALAWLKETGKGAGWLVARADELIMLTEETDAVTITWVNHVSVEFIEEAAEAIGDLYAQSLIELDPIGDDLDQTQSANPYGSFALAGDGTDSCSHAFIEKIKHADWDELKTLMAGFYSQTSEFTGRTSRPKYYNFSYAMKSHAWTYLKERKTYLKSQFAQKRKNAAMSALVAAHAHLFERGNRNANMMAWEME